MEQSKIDRINELGRKQRSTEGLTTDEAMEQAELRKEYIAAIRANLRGSLESIKIQQPDGSLVDVKKRHAEKAGLKTQLSDEEKKAKEEFIKAQKQK